MTTAERVGPLLLSVTEAAHALSIGRTTLYALMARREIVAVHIGRCVRIPADELDRYVRSVRGLGPT